MRCNRKTAVFASLGFGAILALYALDSGAPEPATMRTTRGLGAIINHAVAAFGPSGAALGFVLAGGMLAIISHVLCTSGNDQPS